MNSSRCHFSQNRKKVKEKFADLCEKHPPRIANRLTSNMWPKNVHIFSCLPACKIIASRFQRHYITPMIIKHLTIRNFRKYLHCDLEFPLGVVGVVGRNGSGKSTLLEIFAWML